MHACTVCVWCVVQCVVAVCVHLPLWWGACLSSLPGFLLLHVPKKMLLAALILVAGALSCGLAGCTLRAHMGSWSQPIPWHIAHGHTFHTDSGSWQWLPEASEFSDVAGVLLFPQSCKFTSSNVETNGLSVEAGAVSVYLCVVFWEGQESARTPSRNSLLIDSL